MRALNTGLRRELERAVLEGRKAAEIGVRAVLAGLGVAEPKKPPHLSETQARLRRGLRAKQRQLGGDFDVLLWECAYEQWHRLLFARFLAENGLLRHPQFDAPVTLEDCNDLAPDLGEPDGWSVASRFASEIVPGIFRLDDPCVQLRPAPEHRIGLEKIVAGIPSEVFAADDSLGWVYQYWQSKRKSEVNASGRKVGGADIGPVTQLFTESYMVRFLLENSLGAWWAARHPSSPLVRSWHLLRFDDDGAPAAGSFDAWPDRVAEVTIIDPCCGSGHFLVEALGMLGQMRAEEEGLPLEEAQDAVLRENLFGLELDPRCVQIAMFAVALTAWKTGGAWRELPAPNIACSGIPAKSAVETWTQLGRGDQRLENALVRLHILFRDADTLGSLIEPKQTVEVTDPKGYQRSFEDVEWTEIAPLLVTALARETNDPATAVLGADAAGIAKAADYLSRRYTLAVTNVPFLSRSKQSTRLRREIETVRPWAKGDLAVAIMDRWSASSATTSVVSPQNWQEKPTYEELRERILRKLTYNLFARVGNNVWQTSVSGQPFKLPTLLSILSAQPPPADSVIAVLDIGNGPNDEKPNALKDLPMVWVTQARQLANPDKRILAVELGAGDLLQTVASSYQGLKTGDDLRYKRRFWELPTLGGAWERFQSSSHGTRLFGGCEYVLWWESGDGALVGAQRQSVLCTGDSYFCATRR